MSHIIYHIYDTSVKLFFSHFGAGQPQFSFTFIMEDDSLKIMNNFPFCVPLKWSDTGFGTT